MPLLRWIRELRQAPHGGAGGSLAFENLTAELEAGLRSIDFDGVTEEDRVTFLEQAVVWQVRGALRAGQFDLALELQRYGMDRIAGLERGQTRFRPRVIYGGASRGRGAARDTGTADGLDRPPLTPARATDNPRPAR
jgi:hypothetical protein